MTDQEADRIADLVVEKLARRLATPVSPAPAPPVKKFATVSEYAERVGYSRSTVGAWVKSGLPCVSSGRGHRVNVAAADAWLAAGGAKAAARREALS